MHPDQEAVLQPDRHQRERVEGAEDQADRELAAHEAGEHHVDLAGEPANRRAVLAGQDAVDLGDHPVPVEQQVEGDDRGDEQQHQEVEDPERAGEHAGRHGQPAVAQHGLDVAEVAPERRALAEDVRVAAAEELDQAGDVVGQRGDQRLELADQRRHAEQQRQAEGDHRHDRDHAGRGDPVEPEALEPVGERVEEVGERGAEQERQERRSEQPEHQHEDREGDPPELQLPLRADRHRPFLRSRCARWRSRRGVASGASHELLADQPLLEAVARVEEDAVGDLGHARRPRSAPGGGPRSNWPPPRPGACPAP